MWESTFRYDPDRRLKNILTQRARLTGAIAVTFSADETRMLRDVLGRLEFVDL